jgi:uncharacterized membrane protein YeaQ/YmgE (transglycosylase-associated protein family)
MKQHLRIMFSAQADKAIVAGIVAGIAAIVATGGHYTLVNVLGIAGAVLGAWQATYWTTNDTGRLHGAGCVDCDNGVQEFHRSRTGKPNELKIATSATPIHDTMVAEYTATPVEPTP